MQIFQKIIEVRNFVNSCKKKSQTIALVPTMGSLHQGHLALIKNAQSLNDVVIVTIFVNKAQFNDCSDFENYPKNLSKDISLLKEVGVDILFAPNDEEIYGHDFSFKIIPCSMLDCLCAINRIGHFEGVSLVVTKLFNIVQPNQAFFGEKDFQQLAIIKKLVKDLNYDIEIISCPTVREISGLAMSSRNQRLSESAKIKASMIYKVLCEIKLNPQLIEKKKYELLSNGFEKIEYLEIREEENLKLNMDLNSTKTRRIFVATYLEGIRLIDNLPI